MVDVLFKPSLAYFNPLRETNIFQTPFNMMQYISTAH